MMVGEYDTELEALVAGDAKFGQMAADAISDFHHVNRWRVIDYGEHVLLVTGAVQVSASATTEEKFLAGASCHDAVAVGKGFAPMLAAHILHFSGIDLTDEQIQIIRGLYDSVVAGDD